MFKNKKHIFFDLDDTLWDFEKNSAEVLAELFIEFDLQNKLKTDFRTFLNEYKKVNQLLWTDYGQKKITKTELRNTRFHLTFQKLNYNNYAENLKLTELYLNRCPLKTNLKADCITILEYLKPKYNLHIITNGFKEIQRKKINQSKLHSYFEQIIISEEHQLHKPDPAIFRLAEKLTRSTNQECIVIGDNIESDIKGANSANWNSIYFGEKTNSMADKNISRLIELKEFF
ncbi:MAG: noncanonical pyrimidine nucleotidase, YjjG family [Sphingobacteriaceae bacterium]|nr:noncanonical pyrimidine nucleotidase, YjjG family [Sphingobacteriaceae bacterium]